MCEALHLHHKERYMFSHLRTSLIIVWFKGKTDRTQQRDVARDIVLVYQTHARHRVGSSDTLYTLDHCQNIPARRRTRARWAARKI